MRRAGGAFPFGSLVRRDVLHEKMGKVPPRYSDTDQALRKHVDEEDKLTRQFDGSGQNLTFWL